MGIPIYSLAFGRGADFNLVKGISEDNSAFARKIFEASDATIQLENFYAEISSPLLSNVTFHYVGENLQTAENVLPGSTFNTGSEFVSVVKLSDDQTLPEAISVNGQSATRRLDDIIYPCIPILPFEDDQNTTSERPLTLEHRPHWPCLPPLPPKQKPQVNFIERLWAFLTIEKLLDDKADNGNSTEEERKDKATELALQYNFVTDLTSLVVVKPAENEDGKEESLTGLTPVSAVKSQTFAPHYASFSNTAYSYSAASFGGSVPARRTSTRTKSRHPPLNMHMLNMSGVPRSGRPRPHTTTYRPHTTTTTYRNFLSSSMDYFDDFSDSAYDYESQSAVTTTPVPCVPTDCKLELFSRTLFRKDSLALTGDSLNLKDFDNKVESLRVTGNCRWTLYNDQDHQGVNQSFTPGDYKNAASVRKVLRKASSAKIDGCV